MKYCALLKYLNYYIYYKKERRFYLVKFYNIIIMRDFSRLNIIITRLLKIDLNKTCLKKKKNENLSTIIKFLSF